MHQNSQINNDDLRLPFYHLSIQYTLLYITILKEKTKSFPWGHKAKDFICKLYKNLKRMYFTSHNYLQQSNKKVQVAE